jgi:sulfate adenylyltransferase
LVERHDELDRVLLSLLPLANRMAGLRETLWQALIRRNYGANHYIVSRNYASPSHSSRRSASYASEDAQEQVEKFGLELGIKLEPRPERNEAVPGKSEKPAIVAFFRDPIDAGHRNNGHPLPGRYSPPEVSDLLAETYLPRHRQGICIWFTGLSGAGKSTTAEILTWLILDHGRRVTVLDGDVVRTHLSKGLGFSKVDRDTNVRRIGFVASEMVKLGGIVICAVVSPYRVARNDVRNMVGEDHFVEVFVNTPLEVCEARDVKGMYAKARRGEIKGFTGIDDPYEPPDHPEITLDTVDRTPQENANLIIEYLLVQGFIRDRQFIG